MSPEEEWEFAGFGDRFLADLCDGVILMAVAFAAYLLVDHGILGYKAGFLDDERSLGATDVVAWAWILWNLTYLVGRTGQSLGRRVIGLRVVSTEGRTIGFWRALGRNLFASFISAPALYLGFLWVIWDGQKQAWHDKVFRTYVIRRSWRGSR
jgi:uncharacterized RDD family membrane protein YckC